MTPSQREYPDCPIVGVGAVIIHEGRVLLVKRGNPPLLGEWSLPGGVVELGETLRAGGDAADVRWAGDGELAQYKLEQPALDVIRKAFEKSITKKWERGED